MMTTARSQQIDLERTPYYHCISRVVRRAFLCGIDTLTGQNFDHRKEWLVNRFKYLTEIFAIQMCAYAVMDNHYHLVVHINEETELNWSDEEVINRWGKLFPNDAQKIGSLDNHNLSSQRAQEKLQKWRERLKSISWFMRCLNEPLARLSNKEDDCTGRFWEGRFKIQALLDEAAILSAMAYTDLNPIRAKMALTPEESSFTSIQERIQVLKKQSSLNKKPKNNHKTKNNFQSKTLKQPINLMPFSVSDRKKSSFSSIINFNLLDYLELVDITGRIIREDKRGYIPDSIKPVLSRLNLTSEGWLMMVNHLETDFSHAIGHIQALRSFKPNRIRLFKGAAKAKIYYAA